MAFEALPENEGAGNKKRPTGLDKQREMTKKCHFRPVTEIKPGDVIHHVGLIAGTDFRTLVTAVSEPDADGNVEVFEVNYPILMKTEKTANQHWDVHGRDEEALEMAFRMFRNEA